jgi:hypothetical protein
MDRAQLLQEEGFRLSTLNSDNTGIRTNIAETYEGPGSSGSPLGIFADAEREHSEMNQSALSESANQGRTPADAIPVQSGLRMVYEDPWLIMAGRIYSSTGEPSMVAPELLVWPGDGIRIQDPLPRRLLGPAWKSKTTNQVRFVDLSNMECKVYFILRHTHWGSFLRQLCYTRTYAGVKLGKWPGALLTRIKCFLRGEHDPQWDVGTKAKLWADPGKRSPKARSARLIELLKTVDGMFQQRYFAFPEEYWTWNKFDMFILTNISYLIGDEFLDGALTTEGLGIQTRYSELKKLRKTFKEQANQRQLHKWLGNEGDLVTDVPEWLRQWLPVYRRTAKTSGHRYVYLSSLLSQTRGCGTPPPLVILQSKAKFLMTVTTADPPFSATRRKLIRLAVDSVITKLPGEAFTGLSTKSRITLSTSACWERTRREGGTIGHIHELVVDGRNGVPAHVIDLDTGADVETKKLDEFDSPGEYIFWRCLNAVMCTDPSDLRNAFLTVVKEPGKGRSVTKGVSYLKVVLDLINKLCSEPLKKGVPSSTSGMGKSHHGWNYFNSLFDEGFKKEVFSVATDNTTSYATYEEHERVYHDLFVSSTDYEEATDSMPHEFGALVCERWMRVCGIPPLLRGIVHETCYKPRNIYFQGTGALSTYGEPAPEFGEGIRYVILRRGVLMGDPLTKVVLHFTNIVTREIATGMQDASWLSRGFTNASQMSRLRT